MKAHQSETTVMLNLARELKRASARARRRDPELAKRLDARLKAVLERAAYAEAGWVPPPWPSSTAQAGHSRDTYARVGPFGVASDRLAMFRGMAIDLRNLSGAMIGL
ncbi:MAG: hypothetical protein U0223_07530 [Nitrospira sp.]